jgi:DNA-binding MarR family transcriptional regulator
VATARAALARPAKDASAPNSRARVRLWLRLLTTAKLIENELRRRLRVRFGTTLPRFDLMSHLEREPGGLTLSEVSRRMMVSNGNLTGLVERLIESGHVERRPSDTDRRVQLIRLTGLGRDAFRGMARAHEAWVAELFAELDEPGADELMALLARTKASARAVTDEEPT